MTYRVDWEQSALRELDEIWRGSLDKESIENTATRINIELTYNPLEAGESRDEGFRILFKFPLVVSFRVIERLAQVQVLHVKRIRRTE